MPIFIDEELKGYNELEIILILFLYRSLVKIGSAEILKYLALKPIEVGDLKAPDTADLGSFAWRGGR